MAAESGGACWAAFPCAIFLTGEDFWELHPAVTISAQDPEAAAMRKKLRKRAIRPFTFHMGRLAERAGFEPAKACALPAFEAGALDQLCYLSANQGVGVRV